MVPDKWVRLNKLPLLHSTNQEEWNNQNIFVIIAWESALAWGRDSRGKIESVEEQVRDCKSFDFRSSFGSGDILSELSRELVADKRDFAEQCEEN